MSLPTAPTGFAVDRTLSRGYILLSWNGDKVPRKIKYHLYRDGELIGSVNGNDGAYLDSRLDGGSDGRYSVSAVDAEGSESQRVEESP